MQVIAVVDEKGGVGKTTTAMSLAAICAEASRTLVVDVDPQGSASWWADNAGERLPFDFTAEKDPAVLRTVRDVTADATTSSSSIRRAALRARRSSRRCSPPPTT